MPIFLLIAVGVVGLVFAVVLINFFGLWLRALTSGAPVGIQTLIAMRLRGIPNSLIVNARITAVRAGIEVSTAQLETHYLAGGSVDQVIRALIAADKAGI